jgi:hypothetical protein
MPSSLSFLISTVNDANTPVKKLVLLSKQQDKKQKRKISQKNIMYLKHYTF